MVGTVEPQLASRAYRSAEVLSRAVIGAYAAVLLPLGVVGVGAWCFARFAPYEVRSWFSFHLSWWYGDPWLLALPFTRSLTGAWLLRYGKSSMIQTVARAIGTPGQVPPASVTWFAFATCCALHLVLADGLCEFAGDLAEHIDWSDPTSFVLILHGPGYVSGLEGHPGWMAPPLLRIFGAGAALAAFPLVVHLWTRWNRPRT